jgi:hypothetical protein
MVKFGSKGMNLAIIKAPSDAGFQDRPETRLPQAQEEEVK